MRPQSLTSSRVRRLRAAACALAFVACRREPAPPPAPASVLIGAENVAVVQPGELETGPAISGSLEPERRAVIIAEVAGSVERVAVELGESVERGELLARIAAPALEDALASAQAASSARQQSRDLAERQLERTRRLVQAGALAEQDLELANNALSVEMAQLAQAEAQLANVREQVADAVIRAPFAGVISEVPVHQGDVVTLGARLLGVIDPTSMRLQASVPSESIAQLRVGAPVSFRVRGLGERPFRGRIERVGPAADPLTRQIPLLISLPNPEGALVAGLFADGRIVVESGAGLVVPESALTRSADQVSVRRVTDGRVHVVPIEIGLTDPSSERVLVTAGLSAGDRVLTGAAKELADDTLVRLSAGGG